MEPETPVSVEPMAPGGFSSDRLTYVFAIFTAIVGFLGSLILAIALTTELMPRSFVGRQISKNHLVLIGFCIFVIAWIGAYIGYRLGS